MIRPCSPEDFETIYEIINDVAKACKGIIPPYQWNEPYMPREEVNYPSL